MTSAHGDDLTYAEVGATAREPLPAGYHHVRVSRELGVADLEYVAEIILTWEMHERAGMRLVSGPARAIMDADVAFTFLGHRIPCRIVEVIDETDAKGFAYGTLPGHPECGEERFMVTRDATTGRVTATITAFSRPGSWRTRVLGPIGRAVQARMTQRYLAALGSDR